MSTVTAANLIDVDVVVVEEPKVVHGEVSTNHCGYSVRY